MSYESKRTITSMIAGVVLIIAYIMYVFGRNQPETNNLKSWAVIMLVFIGIGVVSLIVIQILFHIGYSISIAAKQSACEEKEVERLLSSEMVEDEMDKLISLKSSHVAYICSSIGFIAGLLSLALGTSAIFALHIFSGAIAVGTIVEGGVSIYFYERGVQNG